MLVLEASGTLWGDGVPAEQVKPPHPVHQRHRAGWQLAVAALPARPRLLEPAVPHVSGPVRPEPRPAQGPTHAVLQPFGDAERAAHHRAVAHEVRWVPAGPAGSTAVLPIQVTTDPDAPAPRNALLQHQRGPGHHERDH